MLFLGIDVGSSSVKLSILNAQTGHCVASCQHPETELDIAAPSPGFAEQDPALWWECVELGLKKLSDQINLREIQAIGIAYQMHGLVLVDHNNAVLRPAIIWCDSRAVPYGQAAFDALGEEYCFKHLLNSPGNFTAAKLRWVQENEPDIYRQIKHLLLPGDYLAMRLSGEVTTTATGLSEGTLWDYTAKAPATELLAHWDIDPTLIPPHQPIIGTQCKLSDQAAQALGLTPGTPITYRAGDQPNNAFSLNALEPGEVAATAGTSGVIYAVTDKNIADTQGRVNTFLHVSNTDNTPRNGVLACVNGTGRAYSWLRQTLSAGGANADYNTLNQLAESTPIGAEGLSVLPFGNGAERLLQNKNLGAQIAGLDYNRHGLGHWIRATQEGIVFALNTGFDVLKTLGVECTTVKAGKSNMFLSPLFAQAFANTTGTTVELYNTDGAEGAARGAALGHGYYNTAHEAFTQLQVLQTIEPNSDAEQYQASYRVWRQQLQFQALQQLS